MSDPNPPNQAPTIQNTVIYEKTITNKDGSKQTEYHTPVFQILKTAENTWVFQQLFRVRKEGDKTPDAELPHEWRDIPVVDKSKTEPVKKPNVVDVTKVPQ